MPTFARRLSLVVLLALLAALAPMARPALALNLTVNSIADPGDGSCTVADCTLREAINQANAVAGPHTITFNISGTGPHIIVVAASPLPALTRGDTTINGGSAHNIVISGYGLSTAIPRVVGHGISITSANNTVTGLVIIGFPGNDAALFAGGSGIYIGGPGASGNKIYNNWVGIDVDGSTPAANEGFGVLVDDGAGNNDIGGTLAGQGNVISGNRRANVAIDTVAPSTDYFLTNNRVTNNLIGVNSAGSAAVGGSQTSLEAGVYIGKYARGNTIRGNTIGGHIGPNGSLIVAGILVNGNDTSKSALLPLNNVIVGNNIGVTASGTAIPNRTGIRLSGGVGGAYGPIGTLIGDPDDLAGGRNVVGYNTYRGIDIADTSFSIESTRIVGNYIGIDRNGNLAPNGTAASGAGGEALYVGRSPNADTVAKATTFGPGNVVAASYGYGVRIRSNNNVIKGNYLGTNLAGTLSSETESSSPPVLGYATSAHTIWVENGTGNVIGGAAGGDRNVIAHGGSGGGPGGDGILIQAGPTGNCGPSTPCVVSNTTIEGNYIGVKSTGDGGLRATQVVGSYGVFVSGSTGNTIRGNVISGLGYGIHMRDGANSNTVIGNRIGTRAAGATTLANAIRNQQDGIWVYDSTGNHIEDNLIAYNGDLGQGTANNYYGLRVENGSSNSNNTEVIGNRFIANGDSTVATGVFIKGATQVKISESTTSTHWGDGIGFSSGSGANNDMAAPSLTGVSGSPPILAGTAACGAGCTVEVFTTANGANTENREGPIFLTSQQISGTSFSIPVTGCFQYLTATVRDASGNTSPFSARVNAGNPGPCTTPPTITLTSELPVNRSVEVGSSTTYTQTLSHNSPVERTYTLVMTSTLGWASGPALVTVPANGNTTFAVTVSVPPGTTIGTQDTTTLQAFLGSAPSNIETHVTTAAAVTQNPATPQVSPGQTKALPAGSPPQSVSFTHTVTNTGDLAGDFQILNFGFVGSPPTGWQVSTPSLLDSNLSKNESTSFSYTVTWNGPGNPPVTPVQVSFRIGVLNGAQTNPATVDTVTVATVRSFTFSAVPPASISRPVGASADFIYSLTNTGNATDTFQVTAPATTTPVASPPISFSINPSSSFSVAAGATRTITLTAQIQAGTGAGTYDFTVGAQATGGTPPPAQSANGQLIVTGGGVPEITVGTGTPDPVDVSTAGGTVTFVNTLKNIGNQTVPFSFGTPTVPAGWGAVLGPGGTCTNPISLAQDATCTFEVVVTVPVGADGGPYNVIWPVTAENTTPASPVTVNATNVVNVSLVRGLSLSPDPQPLKVDVPGTVLTFNHTLTNLGNATDSFSIDAQTPDPLWTVVITSDNLNGVTKNGTRTITVKITVPPGLVAGTQKVVNLTVRSTGDTTKSATVSDTAEVAPQIGAAISGPQRQIAQVGGSVSFTHQITNTGSTATAFDVSAANSVLGWPAISINPTQTAVLSPGQAANVVITVSVPGTVVGGVINMTTIEVRAAGGTTVLASVVDETQLGKDRAVLVDPDRNGAGINNTTITFAHKVTNIGVMADTYRITAAEAIGWPVQLQVNPDLLVLGPGQSQVVTATLILPSSGSAGDVGLIRVKATSVNDAEVFDSAVDDVTVNQFANPELSASQTRAVTPSIGQIQIGNLALRNSGNARDVFKLKALGTGSGWGATVSPETIDLARGEIERNIRVTVTVPGTLPFGMAKTITVEARSQFDTTKVSTIQLKLVYIEAAIGKSQQLFLPLLAE